MDEKPRKKKVEPSDLIPEGGAEAAEVCPDPSKTPAPPAPEVPVPYPETASAADATSGSKKVDVEGKEEGLKEASTYTKSSGDETGTSATDEAGITGSGGEVSRVDGVKRLGGETVSRLGKGTRRLMEYASGMGPDGYKLLMAALVIGLLGGYATSSLSCGRRVAMLRNQFLELQDGFRDYPAGSEVGILPAGTDVFGGFEITSVAWDLENQEAAIEVTNTGSNTVIIESYGVYSHGLDESYTISTHDPTYGSIAAGGSRTFNWMAVTAQAPSGFLEPGGRYTVVVYSQSGFRTVWIEKIE
jgi:hypothetical protein